MELFSFFKQALLSKNSKVPSEYFKELLNDFKTIDLKHFQNYQLVFIVVDSDNKMWWKITIYGDEFEPNFFVNLFDSKEECDKEIKRLIELPYLNLFDLESAGYDL